jgi:hypothetical protein
MKLEIGKWKWGNGNWKLELSARAEAEHPINFLISDYAMRGGCQQLSAKAEIKDC